MRWSLILMWKEQQRSNLLMSLQPRKYVDSDLSHWIVWNGFLAWTNFFLFFSTLFCTLERNEFLRFVNDCNLINFIHILHDAPTFLDLGLEDLCDIFWNEQIFQDKNNNKSILIWFTAYCVISIQRIIGGIAFARITGRGYLILLCRCDIQLHRIEWERRKWRV